MPSVITEQFTQNIFSGPSGERKTQPTIFDELRWATEHAQNPLEQVIQLISEFHGPWTGMSQQLMQFVNSVASAKQSKDINSYVGVAQDALSLLDTLSQSIPSTVGRVNDIIASNMNIPLLREFVSQCQAIHPTVNAYIQNNIGKYPMFQQISEDVCSFGQVVLKPSEIPPMDRVETGGDESMQTDSVLSRADNTKLYPPVKNMVDIANSLVEVLFLRTQPIENNMALLNPEYGKNGKGVAHGHNFTTDSFNAKREKDAIQPCVIEATSKFGPALQLCNWAFPYQYQSKNNVEFYSLQAEGKAYIADKLNIPITREPELVVASPEFKSSET